MANSRNYWEKELKDNSLQEGELKTRIEREIDSRWEIRWESKSVFLNYLCKTQTSDKRWIFVAKYTQNGLSKAFYTLS